MTKLDKLLASAPLSNRSDYTSWSVSAVEPSNRALGSEPVEPLVGEPVEPSNRENRSSTVEDNTRSSSVVEMITNFAKMEGNYEQ